MKFKVEYNPDFFDDIKQAVKWYNDQQMGLGDRLLTNIRKQTALLSTSALQFAIKYDNIRCICIKKFPFLIHYRVNEETKAIKVEALIHTSRNPKYWEERI
jgi:hypothetical protein